MTSNDQRLPLLLSTNDQHVAYDSYVHDE